MQGNTALMIFMRTPHTESQNKKLAKSLNFTIRL